jgi:hypothetical protein
MWPNQQDDHQHGQHGEQHGPHLWTQQPSALSTRTAPSVGRIDR